MIKYGVENEKQSRNKLSSLYELQVKHPNQVIYFELLIQLKFIEYLLYISTVLSFWFGFSMWTISKYLIYIRHFQKMYMSFKHRILGTIYIPSHSQAFEMFTPNTAKSKRYHRYAKHVISLLLATALIYHVYHTCNLFLLRQVVTKTRIEQPLTFQAPTFSVCFLTCGIYNGSGTCDRHFMANASVRHLNRVTYGSSQLIQRIDVLDTNSNRFVRVTEFDISTYYVSNLKCLSMRLMKGIDLKSAIIIREKILEKMSYLKITISTMNNTVKNAYLYFHKHGTSVPYIDEDNSIDLYSRKDAYVGYTIVETMLLPLPYRTNCYTYKTSRKNCIELCVQRETRLEFNASKLQLVRFRNDTYHTSEEAELGYDKIMLKCSTHVCVNHDCTSQTYKPAVKGYYRGTEHIKVSFVPPDMEYLSEYIPKLSFLDFVVYLGSISGLWLDLNLIAVFSLLSKLSLVVLCFS